MFPNPFDRAFFYTFFGLLIAALLSLATFFSPHAFSLAFWGVLLVSFVLGLWRYQLAVWILLAELFAGSQGRLFSVTLHGFSLSLRIGLFLVLAVLWIAHREWSSLRRFRTSPVFWWFLALIVVIGIGSVLGFLRGNQLSTLFFDVNGYLFIFSALFFFAAIRTSSDVKTALQILIASIFFSALFALVLLAAFSHSYPGIAEIYRWVRDTRMFEITAIGKNFYRIFSQAHIFSLLGFLLFFSAYAAQQAGEKTRRATIAVLSAASITLLMSFSRSYWLSLALTFVVVLFFLFKKFSWNGRRIIRLAAAFFIAAILEITLISFVANYPYLYGRPGGKTTLALLQTRSTDVTDVAAASRYALFRPLLTASLKHPILGSGFGTTVTFKTADPRIVAQNGGTATTFAFEWGYLDTFLKIGVLGVLVFFGLFLALMQEARLLIARSADPWQRRIAFGLLIGLIALYLTHAVSPYLNHPTGLGYLMLMAAILTALRERRAIPEPQP